MKKTIAAFLLLVCLFSLVSCTPKRDTRTVDFFVEEFQEAGFEVTNIETPAYDTLQAEDGIAFAIGSNTVSIYEFESDRAVHTAIRNNPTLQYSPANGRFTIESNDGELMEFFSTIV